MRSTLVIIAKLTRRDKCVSLKMITWSRHSRRIEPIILSTYGLLPWGTGNSQDPLNSHRSNTILEAEAIWRVSVSERTARCGVLRKRLGDLLSEPNLRRVSRDREMDDSPSMVVKYNHGMIEIKYNRGIKHP